MNMKKLMAGVAASALAVSTMAVAASAAQFKTDYQVTVNAEAVNSAGEDGFFTQAQLGHIQKIDNLTITYTTADGETGYVLISTNWGGDAEVEANGITWDGGSFENWTGANIGLPEGVPVEGTKLTAKVSTDVDSEWAQYIEKYPDAAEAAIPDMIILTFGANSGGSMQILAQFAEEAPAETEAPAGDDENTEAPEATEAPAASTGNTSASTADKGNADTGVEGVAVVAAVAVIAAGAIVVAKKRK